MKVLLITRKYLRSRQSCWRRQHTDVADHVGGSRLLTTTIDWESSGNWPDLRWYRSQAPERWTAEYDGLLREGLGDGPGPDDIPQDNP